MKIAKTKLTPRERRHAKQVATLTRWHKKLDQANKTIAKAVAIIPKLEKQLQRYDAMMANAPLKKTEPVLSPPTPQVVTPQAHGDVDIPEFLRRDKVEDKPRPKRRRLSPPRVDAAATVGMSGD